MSGPANKEGELATATPSPRLWIFGSARLDERTLALTVRGAPVKLERKPLEVLLYLLRNAGRVIRKDELLAAVWPGRILSDSALTSCIAKLRDALGDGEQSALRTVHGYGYRLDGEVSSEQIALAPDPPAATAPEREASVQHRPSNQGRRQLVAIMFTDMVGYTALVQRNEATALTLLQQQRQFVRRTIPRYEGREVEVIGDAFLIEFPSALQAVECAIALQQGLAAQPVRADGERLALRIGLHIGDIVRPGKGVFGDSVNIAARLQALAPEGGLAVSGPVFEQVYNKTTLVFEDRGAQQLKGVERPMQVHIAEAAGLLAVATGAPPPPRRFRPSARWLTIAVAVLALLLLVISAVTLWPRKATAPSPAMSLAPATVDRSVAVLPFANLSAATEDRYFADGVQDSVLSKLAAISGLKVISRTSVMQYRETKIAMAEIGAALKVAHVVEGSVQRAGNRIRVTAQLIKVADDSHLWAETYERDLADVFAIQSEIAQHVASAVDVALSARQQATLAKPATKSPEAYNLYVQAAQIEDTTDNEPEILTRIEGLLQQALALDPEFALAHAELANTHMNWYRDGIDATPARLAKARLAMERALALDPLLSEAHTQLGFYHSEGLRDFAAAEPAFRRAIELNPNAAETYEFLGLMYEDMGRWQESIAAIERARALNPRHGGIPISLSRLYFIDGRFSEAIAEGGRAAALAPEDDPVAPLLVPVIRYRAYGDLKPLKTALNQVPKAALNHPLINRAKRLLAQAESRDADLLRLWLDCDCPWISAYPASRKPKDLELADALKVLGRETEARAAYARARTLIEADLRANPRNAFLYHLLALALSGLGEHEAALSAITQAKEKIPAAEVTALRLVAVSEARVRLQAGETEGALTMMVGLLRLPTPIYFFETYDLPWMRPIRSDVRIQRMAAEQRAKAE